MRLLILGGTGMLGHKLYQTTAEPLDAWVAIRGEAPTLAKYSFFCPDRVIGGIDVLDEQAVRKAMDIAKPDAVVNCVGLIKQHPLAKDSEACIKTNALLPHRLATVAGEYKARLVHISTDCVFAGTRGGYTETDLTDAEDLYGRTKALGETAALNAITLRTSIIGRELRSEFGLVDWFLSQDKPVKGFTHAWFSGFTTQELSRTIRSVLLDHPTLTGLYQVASDPIDKNTLLSLLREAYNHPVSIAPCGVVRIDRTLDGTKFHLATGYRPPAWPDMIREMAADCTPYDSWRNK
jgi:dTDP-4-dehydrorhamnose reductase